MSLSIEALPSEIRAVILVFLMAPNKTASQKCYDLLKVVENFRSVSHSMLQIANDDVIFEYACRSLGGAWLLKPDDQSWKDYFTHLCMEMQTPTKRGAKSTKRKSPPDRDRPGRHVGRKNNSGKRTLDFSNL